MKLSTWRPGLVAWLSSKIHIDTWELRIPEVVGEVACFIPPLRGIKHYIGETGNKLAEADQEIFLSYRFSRELPYASLPLNLIEGIYSSICQEILADHQSIADTLDVDSGNFLHSELPIQVSEVGDNYGDWLVTINLHLSIKWIPEYDIIDFGFPGYYINHVGIKVYRGKLQDIQDKILDFSKDYQL